MKQKFHLWIEDYLFFPNNFQKIISFLLLPLTFVYMLIILSKRAMSKQIEFGIPIISIGNIIIGGSGKTPIAIKLAFKYKNSCVILRGYGRKSKGLYVVSNKGKILENVDVSGDEAMLLAKSLRNSTIIVSEDRVKAILKAKELGCEIIFLDDGFSKYKISKFNILLRPKNEPTNIFCLPSGGYREPKGFYAQADIELVEGKDFKRVVTFIKNEQEVSLPQNIVLLTAISKPKRLLEYLPQNTQMISFVDHYDFKKEEIDEIVRKYEGFCFITTMKDFVKLEKFKIKNLYIMKLEIVIEQSVDFKLMDEYINSFKKEN